MSAILLSNTFATPQVPATVPPDPAATAAIAPTTAGSPTSRGGDSTSFAGSGSGNSRQGETVALIEARDNGKWLRQTFATSSPVVSAQAHNAAEALPLGPDLPEVEMPDPLPTSPFLKWQGETT